MHNFIMTYHHSLYNWFDQLISFSSVREIEVIVSVVIVFSLPNERTYHVETNWKESNSTPNPHTKIEDKSLDEELSSSTI